MRERIEREREREREDREREREREADRRMGGQRQEEWRTQIRTDMSSGRLSRTDIICGKPDDETSRLMYHNTDRQAVRWIAM